MRTVPLLVALALPLMVCSACPEDEEAVDARVFIEAMLTASVACEDSFLARAEPVFFRAQLDAQVEIGIVSFERHLDNEQVEFSRPAYNACLAAARASDCATLRSDTGPCASVFRGRLDVEQVCAESTECAPGLSCFQERDQCGVCRPIAVLGDSCVERNCTGGAFCSSGVCAAEPVPAQFHAGDPCLPAQGCGGALSGLSCIDQQCAAMQLVGEGDQCDLGMSVARYCVDSSSTHLCEGGVCSRRPGVGSPCSAAGACDATTSACVEGQCLDEGLPGDSCTTAFACQLGSTCRGGVCVPFTDVAVPPTCASGD